MKSKIITFLTFIFVILFNLSAKAAVFQAGALDPTFGPNKNGAIISDNSNLTTYALMFSSVLVGLNDKIFALGSKGTATTNKAFLLANYTSTGEPNKDFNGGEIRTIDMSNGNGPSGVQAAFLQGDKIVAAGFFTTAAKLSNIILARFNPDGTLDTTFGNQGVATVPSLVNQSANALAVQSDGKIIVNIEDNNFIKVARFTPDGILDKTFGNKVVKDGFFELPSTKIVIKAIAVQKGVNTQDKILLGGEEFAVDRKSSTSSLFLKRLNIGGTEDATFGMGGQASFPPNLGLNVITSLVLQPDGKIVVGATADTNFQLIRCSDENCSSNIPDFNTKHHVGEPRTYNFLNALLIQSDGKFIAGGTAINELGRSALFTVVRYNSNGTIDSTFNGTGFAAKVSNPPDVTQQIFSLALQSDEKILAAGKISYDKNLNSEFALIRYFGKEVDFDPNASSSGRNGGGGGGGCALVENNASSFYGMIIFFSLISFGYLRFKRIRSKN